MISEDKLLLDKLYELSCIQLEKLVESQRNTESLLREMSRQNNDLIIYATRTLSVETGIESALMRTLEEVRAIKKAQSVHGHIAFLFNVIATCAIVALLTKLVLK